MQYPYQTYFIFSIDSLQAGKFFMFDCCLLIFLKKFLHQCQTDLDPFPNQAQHFDGPDLGPNCLQRLSADDMQVENFNINGYEHCFFSTTHGISGFYMAGCLSNSAWWVILNELYVWFKKKLFQKLLTGIPSEC